MACNKCGNQSCLCTGINISSIKGDKGVQGDPGTNGLNGPANTLVIGTVTTGTAAATITGAAPNQTLNLVLPAATGTSNYFAYADDASGTGFTLTPYDSCFLAITDTVATTGSPIASDFTGKYFRINQAVKEFCDADYINNVQAVVQLPNTPTPLTTACPAIQVPVEFFANTSSYIEYKATIKNNTGTGSSDQSVLITVGGTEFQLAQLEGGNFTNYNILLKCYYISPTSIRVVVEQLGTDFHQIAVGRRISAIADATITVAPTTTLDFQITSYLNDNPATGNFEIIGQDLKACNPLKTTC